MIYYKVLVLTDTPSGRVANLSVLVQRELTPVQKWQQRLAEADEIE